MEHIWIGDPSDPQFRWSLPRAGAVPRPVLPPLPDAPRVWRALGRLFQGGQLAAREQAPGCWIGLASPREIGRVLEDAYGADGGGYAHVREALSALHPGTIYYLVAADASAPPRVPSGAAHGVAWPRDPR